VAAVLCFGVRLLLLALLVAAPLAYWRMGVTDWRMGAGAAGVVLLAFIIAWLAALPVRCVVCTQPTLRGSSQPKHPSAAKWLGLSYPARVAWDVLTREYHQCMYCHSRCRNRGPSRKGLGKLASVKTTEWLPDLATLMGPAGVVAVESRKVELVAPVSRLPAQVVEPVLEFPKPENREPVEQILINGDLYKIKGSEPEFARKCRNFSLFFRNRTPNWIWKANSMELCC
jgi:hypothetical protein